MLLGQSKNETAAPAPEYIFDVTEAEFEQRVLLASMEKPVIVDFWAPWCGPCKQLGLVLEKAIGDAKGALLMAKVNVDENLGISQVLRIQSIPTVFAFFQGRPVDAFQGALPESQIKAFIDKLVTLARQAAPDAIDIPEALKQAAQALNENNLEMAQGIYMHILQQDEKNVAAFTGLVRMLIAAGALDQAKQMVENAPPEIAAQSAFSEARAALELAQANPQVDLAPLQEKLAKNPGDHQARYDLAVAQFSSGAREAAMDGLLEIIARNRAWNDEAARRQLLKFFDALGPADPLTREGRRKLSSILFS